MNFTTRSITYVYRPRAGRDKKRWKKSAQQVINNEKHVMCRIFHNRRFDRAVTHEIKMARYLPDDPYKVKCYYKKMGFQ